MPRRIGTGWREQGDPRPIRLRALVRQPMGERIARSGNVGAVPSVGTTRKNAGGCLSNRTGVRAQGNAIDVASSVERHPSSIALPQLRDRAAP